MTLLDNYRFDGERTLDISKVPTNSKSDNVKKAIIVQKTTENLKQIEAYQDKLYAEGKESLIIVLQAMDAAGKDSTVKHVMSGVNPQGIDVYSFKQPTSEELKHDFLWRINKCLPTRGKMAIFNRSYYEDVLVVKVHQLQKSYQMASRCIERKNFFEKRYEAINQYEEYLYDNSYRVLKIFLNVSKKKQKERFLERLNTPEKNWKFSSSDLKERQLWPKYHDVYEECINATGTKHCPWYVLPADQKWYTRYLVSEAILNVLEEIDPGYPVLPSEEQGQLDNYRRQLETEK